MTSIASSKKLLFGESCIKSCFHDCSPLLRLLCCCLKHGLKCYCHVTKTCRSKASPWFQLRPPGTQIKTNTFLLFFLRTGNTERIAWLIFFSITLIVSTIWISVQNTYGKLLNLLLKTLNWNLKFFSLSRSLIPGKLVSESLKVCIKSLSSIEKASAKIRD